MRRLFVQFLIASASIGIVLFVFSVFNIVTFGANGLIYVLALGLILAIANVTIRPFLLLFTGRWLISSFGLALIVIDTIVLWLAAVISPLSISFKEPTWFWIPLATVLIIVLSTTAELVLGVDRPSFDVSDRQRAIWRVLDSLPTPRRSSIVENLRLMQVYETISSFGFDIALESGPLAPIRDFAQGFLRSADPRLQKLSVPAKVRIMLQQLGPTYVKIGQMAASRSEALPPGWADELEKLQNTVPPFSWEEADKMIRRELGASPDELYATIDHEPLAAASLAQVHKATLPDGTEVVVKIQRPDVVTMVQADLGVLQELATTAERRFDVARRLDLKGVVEEFADGVTLELDYRNEAYHMRRMAENMRSIGGVTVPFVDDRRSGVRVMTMGFANGVKINDVAALDAAGIDRDELGRRFLRAIIKQVLIDGFFHADPHPGNVLVDTRDGTIVFLDLGLVGQLTVEQRTDLLDLLASIQAKDSKSIAAVAMRMCTHSGPVDQEAVFRAVDRIVYQYLIYGGGGADLGQAVSSILGSLYDQGLRMDQDFTLAIKAIIQAEEITTTLAPSFDLIVQGVDDAKELILAEFTAEKIVEQVKSTAIATGKEVLRRVPSLQSATLSWLDQYQKGKLVVEVDTTDLNREVGRFAAVGGQLAAAAIVAGAVVGAGIVVAALIFAGPTGDTNLDVVLVLIFVGLVLFGVVMAWRMFRGSARP